jgi:NADPH:quinone reductase-like Zn-dependent oxidoreductase
MNVCEIQGDFGLENLVLTERDTPEPGPGEILIEMKAASPNYRDVLMIRGHYNPRQPLPLIPFSDGAGEVVECGEGVREFAAGDRVMPIFAQGWQSGEPSKAKFKTTLGGPLDGTLAEYMVVREDAAVRVPQHLSYAEASTLPCAGVTAWNALFEHGDVRAGDTVVLQGTGGVSMFGTLFALNAGAEVIQTSSSDEKLEKLREMGVAHTINYRETGEWGREVKSLTGEGADHIIEVGGAGTLEQSLQALRIGGHLSMIGVLSGTKQELSVIPILMRNIRVQGILVGHREMFQRMCRAMEVNELRPPMDRTFAFEDLHDGLNWMIDGNHMGKVVIELG